MIKVTVKKLHVKDLEVLQSEMEIFVKHLAFQSLTTDFLNTIITFDIAQNLYFLLRMKIEQGKTDYNVSFSVSQAATILKCCNYNRAERSLYTKHVMTKLNIDLDKQLKDLV